MDSRNVKMWTLDNTTTIEMKVAEPTQIRPTPFKHEAPKKIGSIGLVKSIQK
jgi:hypothetical protein